MTDEGRLAILPLKLVARAISLEQLQMNAKFIEHFHR